MSRLDSLWQRVVALVRDRVAFVQFEADLGAGQSSGSFDLATTQAGLAVGALVEVVQTAAPIGSKGNARDEPEVCPIIATGYALTASTVRIYWATVHGDVAVGSYAFAYRISG